MSGQINKAPIEIHYFRKSLALVQMGYYISLFSRFNDFFGAHGWMGPSYRTMFSVLSLSESNYWRWFLLAIMFVLLILFFKGVLNRLGLAVFYILNLSFYLWNPYIMHEPQPLTNLFFISFFFLPMRESDDYDPWITNILIVFLGLYYFLAGIKKLPDANFINGSAITYIISWPIMAKSLKLNLFLVKYFGWMITIFNYGTLVFELSFIFLVFTRWRIFLIFFGLLMHLLIYFTLEVGNLSFVMLCWYVLLLDAPTRAQFRFAPQIK